MKYKDSDLRREYILEEDEHYIEEPYRSEWSRDLSRVIHSHAFKRLQGKTQLLPGQATDYFRNRLTHSMEVAQIAKSIAHKLNYDLKTDNKDFYIEPELCEIAALSHDIGRPPLGHLGEAALNMKMKDSGGFEANAQTLRILTKLAKKHYVAGTVLDTGLTKDGEDLRIGLNLTYRSLASVLKYDQKIPEKSNFDTEDNIKLIKGYYESEEDIVKHIKEHVTGKSNQKDFKTVECQILDFAGDIAYATYDLNDAFKIGFVEPLDIISLSDHVLSGIVEKINRNLGENLSIAEVHDIYHDLFKNLFVPAFSAAGLSLTPEENDELYTASLGASVAASKKLALNGYYRVNFISNLIGKFIKSVEISKINEECPALSKISIPREVRLQIEALKNFMYQSQVLHPQVKVVKHRGVEIISYIFDNLSDKKKGVDLLPLDIRVLYDHSKNEMSRKRIICDYIAAMADDQAVELYKTLTTGEPRFTLTSL